MRFAGLALALGLLPMATAALAQSAYLPDGRNATVLGASYFSTEGYDGYGGQVGLGLIGTMVVGARFDHAERDASPDVDWDDFTETSVAPFLSVLAFRPAPEFPVGLDCRASFAFASFEGEHVDGLDQAANGTKLNFGMELFGRLEPVDGLRLMPHVAGDFYAWSVGSQVAYLDPDLDHETSELERFDSDDLPQWGWAAGVSLQFAEQFVVTLDLVEVELEEPALRLGVQVLYPQNNEWWR